MARHSLILCQYLESLPTRFDFYSGNKPSVRHLKPYGVTAYVGVPRQLGNKLQTKSKKGIFIGYSLRTKDFCAWLLDDDKVGDTINVSFNESNPKESSHS